jgi:enamine deaminase RidA (YjgF/YER057c/UK114 family)
MNKSKTIMLAIFGVLIAGCQPPATGDKGSDIEFLHMPGNENSGAPFSSAVRVDNILYLSGVIGVEPGTLQVPESGIEAEARLAMEEIKATVEAFGSSMDRVVKCQQNLHVVFRHAARSQWCDGEGPGPECKSGSRVYCCC